MVSTACSSFHGNLGPSQEMGARYTRAAAEGRRGDQDGKSHQHKDSSDKLLSLRLQDWKDIIDELNPLTCAIQDQHARHHEDGVPVEHL